MKRLLGIFLLSFFTLASFSFAQEEEETIITGTVEEIAEDGDYVVVAGQKIITTEDFLEDAYFEVGDKVKIAVENSEDGFKAIDYDYNFSAEDESYDSEEETLSEESFPEE